MARLNADIVRALEFASRKHAGQWRKYGGGPFVVHPIRVAGRLSECLNLYEGVRTLFNNFETEGIIAALLHDTIEDCDVSFDEIAEPFGIYVAKTVQHLTNPSKAYPKFSRAVRKQMDLEHIRTGPQHVHVLKMLDRIDNLSDMQQCPLTYLQLYLKESEALYDTIGPSCSDVASLLMKAMSWASENCGKGTEV